MSADGHTVCPNCHPDLADYTEHDGALDHAAEDLGYARDVRERWEFTYRSVDGALVLAVEYSANCWTCGWSYELDTAPFPLTGLTPTTEGATSWPT